MSKYRQNLPQLSGDLFLTDGGLETTLIFHEGLNLPNFAAFDLFRYSDGQKSLEKYFCTYAALATEYRVGLVLESATWRANPDWATKLGYSREDLICIDHQSIQLLQGIRKNYETEQSPIVISGCVGPRGDGYHPEHCMTADEAATYHQEQIAAFQDADADLVTAMTMNYTEEALGITFAAQAIGMPVVISFTVETNGDLPTGQTLKDAIAQIDAATHNGPAYYMINCAHPTHFAHILPTDEPWLGRIRGLRANASTKSHAELDEAEELDAGNPAALGSQYRELKQKLQSLNVLGGCCGTDHRHVRAIYQACASLWWHHMSGTVQLQI
ncbi:homocysteine S-methyltransferase [Fischerella thermalis CCMEE 5319]|uniref:Putative homocysteine S-methyltransferase n=1 Tax=Fischerella sp. MV11 TaxID=397321 RepID=E1U3N9_9CYAN|nr:putative homocysteine S-methyltransferase [Fischerella sp. MV11]PMB34359.1 homocysteine S-methyltransferase [Fischerella thermalis CCMEE 5319]